MRFSIDKKETIIYNSNKYFIRIRTCDESNYALMTPSEHNKTKAKGDSYEN